MSDNTGVDKGRDIIEANLNDHQEMRRRFRERPAVGDRWAVADD